MKIGIFGGSFNPIHNGHVHLAENTKKNLGLDKIIFVPSRISPHKSSSAYVSGEHRINMLKIALSGKDYFEISDYELQYERVSYSIYTVMHFRRIFPDDELYLLIGSDMFMSFDKWYCFKNIMSLVTLAVTSREDGDLYNLEKKASELERFGKIIINKTSPFPLSSSEIRKKIMKNENCTCYLNKNVVKYITSNNLYL